MKIAINGFGRIGRTILRQLLTRPRAERVEVVLINDIAPAQTCAYLFKYDSTFGPLDTDVTIAGGALCIGDHAIAMRHASDLTQLDLRDVDVVLECTGIARSSDVARRGLTAGAAAVLISGPSPAAEVTVVQGANEGEIGAARVVSNASCTTNAVAPLVRLLDEIGGITRGHFTTIHCYTNSQPMVDAPRGDLARSRAGALSMVPTSTSAAHLLDLVLPHIAGRISGAAVRVPTASVSAVDLSVQLSRPLSEPVFRDRLREAVAGSAVLGWTDEPLVSSDLRARPESLILAGPELQIVDDQQVRVFGWYDNEWGFSARMIDVALLIARRARTTL